MSLNDNLISKEHERHGSRSLILAGGGMRLSYQAGVLMALQESSLRFTHVDGTSGGIFNAAMLASGVDSYSMADRWRKLKTKWFVSMAPAKDYLRPLTMKGYTDADNIRKKVFPALGIDIEKLRSNVNVTATFNVCNFSEKAIESICNTRVTEDHLIAGVSLPMVMPALRIGADWYTDAVWIKDANLLEGVRQRSEQLWLVWAIGNCATYLPGALNQYVHMIEMSANGALLEEYKQITRINEDIHSGRSTSGQKNAIRLFVIKPEFPLPLDPDLFFDKIDTRSLINMGYADGKRCLEELDVNGVPMDEMATRMSEPGVRLNFRGAFGGKLRWMESTANIMLYTYFCVHRINGAQTMRLFSSLYVQALGREVCLYDLQVITTKVRRTLLMKAEAKFVHDGIVYDVRMAWALHSPVDFLLGLEFKIVRLTVSKAEVEVMTGLLRQSAKARLRNCYTTNVRTEDGGHGGIKSRYSMIANLIDHGI